MTQDHHRHHRQDCRMNFQGNFPFFNNNPPQNNTNNQNHTHQQPHHPLFGPNNPFNTSTSTSSASANLIPPIGTRTSSSAAFHPHGTSSVPLPEPLPPPPPNFLRPFEGQQFNNSFTQSSQQQQQQSSASHRIPIIFQQRQQHLQVAFLNNGNPPPGSIGSVVSVSSSFVPISQSRRESEDLERSFVIGNHMKNFMPASTNTNTASHSGETRGSGNNVNDDEYKERREQIIKSSSLFPLAIPRPAKRKASLEKDDEKNSKNKNELEDHNNNNNNNINNVRRKVDEFYAASLLPPDSFFRLEMFEKKEVIKDQLATLIQRARVYYCVDPSISQEILYGCYNACTVRVMFVFCQRLKVNLHTFFTALEIFDKYVTLDNDRRTRVPELNKITSKPAGSEQFRIAKDKLRVQVPLRIATCIHLAAKIHGDSVTQDVSISNLVSLLKTVGHHFSRQEVIKSEFQIFSQLDFRLNWPQPLEMVELILAAIDLPVDARMEAYMNCVCLLFFAYQFHHELYDELWDIKYHKKPEYIGNRRKKNVVGRGIQAARKEFREKIESNIPLLSGAIVSTSLVFKIESLPIGHAEYSQLIANELGIPKSCILDFSISFLKLVHKETANVAAGSSSSPSAAAIST